MRNHRTMTKVPCPGDRSRRGSTLLMVLTAMSACIVLSGAFVAARSNSAVVGANLVASSRARVEVESALAITLAALSSSDSWRTNNSDGVLYTSSHDDVQVRTDLIDLATGQAPDATSVDIRATIRARVGAIERVAEADFFVALPAQSGSIDVDLGEFALFAGDSIIIRAEGLVQPWSISPAIVRGDPIRVATADGTPGAIGIEGSGSIVGGIEFRPEGVSRHESGLPVTEIPDSVAVPLPAPPQDFDSATVLDEPMGRIASDARTSSLKLSSGAILELAAGVRLLVEGDLEMSNGAVLRIEGDSSLVIQGNMSISNARIEVPEDARLDVHVGGDLDFNNARVTEPLGTEYTWIPELDRVRFLSLVARETVPIWIFRGRTIVKGECYAPSVDVRLQGESIFIGRITAQRIRIEGRSCLLYDPALDDRNGYTAADGRAYDEFGRLPDAIARLEDLSFEQLTAASNELGIPLIANDTYIEPNDENDGDYMGGIENRSGRNHHGIRAHWNRFRPGTHRIFSSRIRHIGHDFVINGASSR